MKKIFISILAAASILGLSISSCSSRKLSEERAPLIGISGYISADSKGAIPGAVVFKGSHSFPSTYIESVAMAGGVPVLLPAVRDINTASQILDKLDAVIFIGGADFDPVLYGEEIIPEAGVSINSQRDTSDILYAKLATAKKIPVLGICRGEQLLNIALGGTLYQDIPLQHHSEIKHRATESGENPLHTIKLVEGTPLATALSEIAKDGIITVNSSHHQAVKDLAPGLIVTAWAEDGIVEGFCNASDGPYGTIVGVQFHPEKFIAEGDTTLLPILKMVIGK